eukprot:1215655-Pyramimonas_sp.AAC.1
MEVQQLQQAGQLLAQSMSMWAVLWGLQTISRSIPESEPTRRRSGAELYQEAAPHAEPSGQDAFSLQDASHKRGGPGH